MKSILPTRTVSIRSLAMCLLALVSVSASAQSPLRAPYYATDYATDYAIVPHQTPVMYSASGSVTNMTPSSRPYPSPNANPGQFTNQPTSNGQRFSSNVNQEVSPFDIVANAVTSERGSSEPGRLTSYTVPASATTRPARQWSELEQREQRDQYERQLVSRYNAASLEDARLSAERYRNQALMLPPLSSKISSENANLVAQWAQMANTFLQLSQQVNALSDQVDETQRDFDNVQTKLERSGVTPMIGMLLRQKQESLDAWKIAESNHQPVTHSFVDARKWQLPLDVVRFDGASPETQTAEILGAAGISSNHLSYASLSTQINQLLYQRHDWIRAIEQLHQDYQHRLGEFDTQRSAMQSLVTDYETLIRRQIVWIPSDDVFSWSDVRAATTGFGSLFDANRSAELGYSVSQKWKADRSAGVTTFLLILMVMVARWRAKTWLVEIGARKIWRDGSPNARKAATGALTILVAFAIPAAMYLMARWLGSGVTYEAAAQSSRALYAASLVALWIELPRQLLCNYGYVEKHTGLELPRRGRALAYLTLIGLGLVMATYVIAMLQLLDRGLHRESAARLSFLTAATLVAWTAHLATKPTGGFLEPFIAKYGGSVIYRLRFVIYSLCLAFPISMGILSALGYGYAATELTYRAILTMIALMIGIVTWSILEIAANHAWRRLTVGNASSDHNKRLQLESSNGVLAEQYLELKHQLAFIFHCAALLVVIFGMGKLWATAFPAAKLGNPVLWSIQQPVSQASLDQWGRVTTETLLQSVPVTALHLVTAFAVLFIAFQLAKLLPGLFDALVLQRVSFDEAMEHLTLVAGRCVIFGAGCLIAGRLIGLRWETLQWLVVGLTIGIGFGMQDVVRNLLGGLVVLFEKPARLGDRVTIGRVTGRVAAQRFRTTLLSDDEGREVIIPNKNFLNDEVIHWMGAGRLRAVSLEVAVTRDQRSADVCRELQQLVLDQPDVLLSPAPQASLICVSKQSQRIEIRTWVEDRQDPTRYRDSLLRVVTKHLREKEWLATDQPTQPPIRDERPEIGDSLSSSSRLKKRLA